MLTLTSKTCFGAMCGYQEQTHEGDLGGSHGHGWTGRPKADNILLVRWGVTFTPQLTSEASVQSQGLISACSP